MRLRATPAKGSPQLGLHFLGGLLAHAHAAAAFSTPTINGYKRYRAYTLAPDRAIWARDNRGVMVRVLGQPGDPSTHLENRIGEPAANPYLYMASQIYAGLDGMAQKRDPGPSADTPYETKAPLLPKDLGEALAALRASEVFRKAFGEAFVDYYAHLKEAELARFKAEASERQRSDGVGAERVFRFVLMLVIPGRAKREPGIHSHGLAEEALRLVWDVSEYGFRTCRCAAIRNDGRPHTSTLATSAFASINTRRGSTLSPISSSKIVLASSISLTLTCSIVRALVSSVVSHSCCGFISPRPL